jgi:hypothetical protein
VVSTCLAAGTLPAVGEEHGSATDPIRERSQETSRQSSSGAEERQGRATNTEKTDRGHKDEEIGNAPPPPVRVRKKPALY